MLLQCSGPYPTGLACPGATRLAVPTSSSIPLWEAARLAVESQQQGDGPGIPLSSTQPRQLLGRLNRSSLNFKEKSR